MTRWLLSVTAFAEDNLLCVFAKDTNRLLQPGIYDCKISLSQDPIRIYPQGKLWSIKIVKPQINVDTQVTTSSQNFEKSFVVQSRNFRPEALLEQWNKNNARRTLDPSKTTPVACLPSRSSLDRKSTRLNSSHSSVSRMPSSA